MVALHANPAAAAGAVHEAALVPVVGSELEGLWAEIAALRKDLAEVQATIKTLPRPRSGRIFRLLFGGRSNSPIAPTA